MIYNIRLLLSACAFFVAATLSAQNMMNVTGQVKDSNGDPIVGAAVMVEGTSVGVVTDLDGRYSISFRSKDGKSEKLSFSSISYLSQKIKINGRNVINVTLEEDHEQLDEVVVVGYGAMRKSDITGAVTSVKVDEEQAMRTASLDQLLQGQAAGVQIVSNSAAPDAGISVTIRGASSFNSSSQPLYVVDGVLMNTDGAMTVASHAGGDSGISEDNNGLMGISPQDIASMEILKDASATAIYGSQGANGVILITTKSATKGKPSVTFSGGVNISHICKKYDLMDAEDYKRFLELKGVDKNSGHYTIYTDSVENGTYIPVDWQDYSTRVSVTQRYNFSVSGNPKNTNYRFSIGYYGNEGVIKGTGYKNIFSRLNLEQKIGNFKLGTKTSVSYLNSKMTQGAGATLSQTPASSLVMSMLLTRPLRKVVQLDGEGLEVDDNSMPLSGPDMWMSDYQNARTEIRITPNIYAEYKPLPWLTIKTTFGADYRSNERYVFKSSRINGAATGSTGAVAHLDRLNWNWDNLIMFNKSIKKHYISGTVGHSAVQVMTKSQNVEGINIYQWKSMIDSLNTAPYCWLSYGETSYQLLSFFARLIYSYNQRYVLTATYRFDGSSKFAAENKWAQFPSLAFAWRINNEPWFKRMKSSFPAFTSAKLRLGWGRTGNQNIPSYQTTVRYSTSTSATHDNDSHKVVSVLPSGLASKNLKWETTEQYNLGLDLDFFKGRLTLSAEGYYKVTNDLLQRRTLAASVGVNDPYVNMGSISNTGFELTFNAVPVAKKNIEWTIGGNFTLNRNKILSIDPNGSNKAKIYLYRGQPAKEVEYFSGNKLSSSDICNDYLNIFIAGMPMSLFYAMPTDGIVQEGQMGIPFADGKERGPGSINFIDTNGDKKITADDRVIVGDPNPDFIYGFNTSFRYKGLSVSAQFSGSYGNDVFNQQFAVLTDLTTYSANRLRTAVFDAWTPQNTDSKYPAINAFTSSDYNWCTDRCVEDGSYLRLANLSISYKVPINWRKSIVKHFSFGVSAKNLCCWTSYSGYDPDVNIYGNVLRYGIDMGAYPAARTYMFDFKISF